MEFIIETNNLTKRYGTATVVDKVNLHVPKGEIYALLGRNGAGKITAMKMMLKLTFPTDGAVRLFGKDYKDNEAAIYSKIGSIIETPGFYGNLTGNGTTIFISRHVLSEIEQIADIIGVMHEGHLIEEIDIVELHKRNRKYTQFDLSDGQAAAKILFTLSDVYNDSVLYTMLLTNMMVYVVIAAFLFSREYTESTLKTILPIPISRTKLLLGKFCVLLLWIVMLTIVTWAVQLSQIKNGVQYIRGQPHFFLCRVKSRVPATPLPYLWELFFCYQQSVSL